MINLKNKKFIISVSVLILATIAGISIWINHREHKQEVLAQMKRYNDSLENVQRKLLRLEQLRTDSIAREKELRFSVNTLISDIEFEEDCGHWLRFGQSIRKEWEQNILNLGFEKQPKKLEYSDESEYNDELYDGYSVPYTRMLNGRLITVKAMYTCYKRAQDGTWIPEKDRGLDFVDNSHLGSTFKIIFSHTEDMDYFEKSIRELGLTKHQTLPNQYNDFTSDMYYYSDPDKYKGNRTLPKKERGMCPSVRIYIDSISFTIHNDIDC